MGRIIEISGVKLELDERTGTLKNVDTYKVGDNVKLLKKQYDQYKSLPAVIVGFDDFPNQPTIVVAYLEAGYNKEGIQFAYVNEKNKDFELCPMGDYEMVINKNIILAAIDDNILRKEREIAELKMQREYFLATFGRYFTRGEGRAEAVSSGVDA